MIKITDLEFVGQFNVKSGKLRISDPCYDKKTWCSGIIEDVKNGVWEAYVKLEENENRVSELLVIHKNITKTALKNSNWIEQDIDVGVDSGQCGFFDEDFYPEEKTEDDDSFYGKICDITLSRYYGTIDFGAVSSSGYGDGSYLCYTIDNKDGVIGAKVVFIEESEIDEDDDDFEDYDNDIDYDFDDDN